MYLQPLLRNRPPKATEFGEITQTTRPLRRSGSFKVTDFGTNRKPLYLRTLWRYTNAVIIIIIIIIKAHMRLRISDYLLSCSVFQLRLIICNFSLATRASDRRALHFNALAGVIPCEYRHKWYTAENYIIRATFHSQNNANYTSSMPFKVIQGHRFWYQSKAHMRVPINLPPILYRFQVMADYWPNFRYRHGTASL